MVGSDVRLPSVTVVVPVRNDPRLAHCLQALGQQDYPPELVDVIVADNGSREDLVTSTEQVLRDMDLSARLVIEPRGGSYAARNAALRLAKGEVVAFTDADCLPEPSWLSSAVRALGSGAGVVAGRVRVFARDARRPHPVEAYELVHAFPQQTYVSRDGACVTANLVTTREVLDATGPFLDDLMSGADIEWSQRANRLGFRTRYVDDAVVRHPARQTYREVTTKLERVMSGRAERDRLEGRDGTLTWPRPRAWVPPLGAFRRAFRNPDLVTPVAKAAFVVGEFHHRYAAAVIAAKLAFRDRRA